MGIIRYILIEQVGSVAAGKINGSYGTEYAGAGVAK